LAALAAIAAVSMLPGCGGVYYAINVQSASSRVEQARAAGAEKHAPFEYYYAKAHLEQAQREASEASYSDAAAYAETAEQYAQKAIDMAQSAQRAGATP
jgi:hypothetical protein